MPYLNGYLHQLGDLDQSELNQLSSPTGLEVKNKNLNFLLAQLQLNDVFLKYITYLGTPMYQMTGAVSIKIVGVGDVNNLSGNQSTIPVKLSEVQSLGFSRDGSEQYQLLGSPTFHITDIDIPIIYNLLSFTQLDLNVDDTNNIVSFGTKVEALPFINSWAKKILSWANKNASDNNKIPVSIADSVQIATLNVDGSTYDGQLQNISFNLKSGVIGIPIIPKVLEVTGISGTIVSPWAKSILAESGNLRLSGLPVPIPIPNSLLNLLNIKPTGQAVNLSILSANIGYRNTGKTLEGNGDASLLWGLFKGDGKIEINKERGTALLEGTFNNPITQYTGSFQISTQGDVTAKGTASLKLPFIGGNNAFSLNYFNNRPIAESNFYVSYKFLRPKTVGPWGIFSNPFKSEEVRAGYRVSFDGSYKKVGGKEIPDPSGNFSVDSGQQDLILDAKWDNPSTNVPITITAPDGTVINQSDLVAGTKGAEIVQEATNSTQVEIDIAAPSVGNWNINIPDNLGLGNVAFTGYEVAPPATVNITNVNVDTSQSKINIAYQASDNNPNASVDLYYDDASNGFQGYAIAQDLSLSGTYSWDVSGLPSDNYHFYAVVKDDVSAPTSSYYQNTVNWVESGAPDQVQGLTAKWLGKNEVELNWNPVKNATSYDVKYSSDAAGIGDISAIQYASTSDSEPGLVIPNLTLNQVYSFEVQAIDSNQNSSPESKPVIAEVGVGQTAPLSTDEWQANVLAGTTYTATEALQDPATQENLTLSLLNPLPGQTFDSKTGIFSWVVPTTIVPGEYSVNISAVDAFGEEQTISHDLFVNNKDITINPNTINLANFSDLTNLQVNGSASGVGNVLRLVSNQTSQSGNAFDSNIINLSSNTFLESHFQFQISSTKSGSTGDGFTFTLQDFDAGTEDQSLQSVGSAGGFLGYYNPDSNSPSLAISFDTHKNTSVDSPNGKGWNDPSDNFIGILSDGNVEDPLTTATPGFQLADGQVHDAWIDYDSRNQLLSVFVSDNSSAKPTTPVLSYNIDLSQALGGNAFAGFTASTGDLTNTVDVLNWHLGAGDIVASNTTNQLTGTSTDDVIFANTQGGSTLTGGSAANIFKIADGLLPSTLDTITNFQASKDTISISHISGITSYNNLTLTQQGQDTLVSNSGKSLAVLTGIQANTLNSSNFLIM